MRVKNLIISIFLVLVLVLGSTEFVSAEETFTGSFFDLFSYLFTPSTPQFAVDRDDGGLGGGGSTPVCAYDCKSSCVSGEVEMTGSCIAPLMCCRTLNVCNDHFIDGGEDCEGLNLNGETCESLGYASGTLSCDAVTCAFDETNCVAGNCVPLNLTAFVWELTPGFNFVSLPLNEIVFSGTDTNITNISGITNDAMFSFDALNNQWLVGYKDILDQIGDFETARGYIYYANVPMNLSYYGAYNDTHVSPLINGSWNLIGVPRNDTINGLYGAGTYTVYEWDGAGYIDVSGAVLNTVKSYWVYIGVPELAPPSFSFWDWLLRLFS